MTVRMRHTRSHTRNRRSHHALKTPRLSKCDKCGALHLRHRMCTNCGFYKGREVIDVMSKILKKEAKKKEVREAKSG
ncbi:MAG: 50S ribosomal protein L32, partial [Candidatus Peribacteraceae bacterium]|nr:50S ribosomal protein L32 [Candidatus Peribacteraceae bacterium]